MKKLVLSTVAAAMLATSASAVTVGLGTDVLGGQSVLRIAVDGLAKGLRVEPRFAYASYSTAAATPVVETSMTLGIGAYYDVVGPVAVGVFYDMTTVNVDGVNEDAGFAPFGNGKQSTFGFGLKAEKELTKNLSLAYELGYSFNSTTSVTAGTAATVSDSTVSPYSSVTMRLFF